MKLLLQIIFTSISMFLASVCFATQTNSSDTGLSSYRIEQKMDSTNREILEIEKDISIISNSISDLKSRKDKLNSFEYDHTGSFQVIKNIRNLLNKWMSQPKDHVIAFDEIDMYLNLYDSLIRQSFGKMEQLAFDTGNHYLTFSSRRVDGGLNQLKPYEGELRKIETIEIYKIIDTRYADLYSLYNELSRKNRSTTGIKKSKVAHIITKISNDLSENGIDKWHSTNKSLFETIKSDIHKWLDQITSTLESQSKNLSAKLINMNKELAEYDTLLVKKSQQEAKAKRLTNYYETFSVNFMIGGIILILLILLYLSKGQDVIALKLIERRTLVEILSMGFLLLAVIILGTSDKIHAETLGTLLGTIAGYVFGKQMAERSSNEEKK